MRLMHRRCAHPGCALPSRGGKCQDCGKAFCPGHVDAHEFAGFRGTDGRQTAWMRFVCAGCGGRATRTLLAATARVARDQARQDAHGAWWEAR
jgi:hypothetical protein